MRRKIFVFSSIALTGILIAGIIRAYLPPPPYEAYGGVKKFGHLRIGEILPHGGPGDYTTDRPLHAIPISNFYVFVVEPDMWCSLEYCGLSGAFIRTMGGWLESFDTEQSGFLDDEYGLDLPKNEHVTSIVLIGDQNGTMVGIYPNKKIDDLIPILKLHPDLAHFERLAGVDEFGPLKVGALAPIKHGDLTGYVPDEGHDFPFERIPEDKRFYLFAIQKELLNNTYCAFDRCQTGEYFDPIYIKMLGGWFSSDGKPETARLFGLDPEEVLRGTSSLVVVTDKEGVIASIHPNKTIADAPTILSQHPDLADVKSFYLERGMTP